MKKDKKIELLLTDLCARLPYGIFVKDEVDDKAIYTIDYHPHLRNCKPYLRPISSMTEKETIEHEDLVAWHKEWEVTDWLNAHHFAYRTLNGKDMFELGIAIVAPEGMYNIKK